MDAKNFLESLPTAALEHFYVLHGQDDFLKRQAGRAIRRKVLATPDQPFGFFDGEESSFAEVHEEIATLSMFGGTRLAWVEQADTFVSNNREALELLLDKPSKNGVLVLEVKSWTSTTRLAKKLSKTALVECTAPSASEELARWCMEHAKESHRKPMSAEAARLLSSLVGPDLGRLDQEIAKLACYSVKAQKIEAADVDKLVGLGQVEKVWKLMDFLAQGENRQAFKLLGELFESGEDPIKILGACGYNLRKLAAAGRLLLQDKPMPFALERAGFPPFARNQSQILLQKFGRTKVKKILSWLVEADAGMKGASPLPPRALLERLVTRLAAR